MKSLIAVTGLGAVVVAAAVAGGVGVAFAFGGGDDTPAGHGTMIGTTMQMDPAAMQSHMRELLGDEAFEAMQGHMLQALGEEGYASMLGQMAEGCGAEGMAMSGAALDPADHLKHHPGSANE